MEEEDFDIRDKMEVACNVLSQCEIHERTQAVTVLPISKDYLYLFTLKHINKHVLSETISFNQLSRIKDSHVLSGLECSAEIVRLALKEFYLNKQQIPGRHDIMSYVEKFLKVKENLTVKYSKSSNICVRLQMPGMKKGIIIEDPERVFKRIEYIKKMAQAREQQKHIVYIDSYSSLVPEDVASVTAVSSKTGLLSVIFPKTQANKSQEALLIDLMSAIEGKCVFVLEEQELEEIPSICSTKAVMSKWLTKNGIAHDPLAHRADLYNLINRMKHSTSWKSKTDEVIAGLGHEVIRRPQYTHELDFYYRIHSNIDKVYLKNELESITLNSWMENESFLIEAEKSMYNDDLQMEKIIDNLILMAKNGELPEDTPGLLAFQEWNKVYREIIFH